MLTCDQVASVLPATLKKSVTQSFVDQINNIVTDPVHAEAVRENFISYTRVLQDGKYKIQDYLHAVTYVSFKLMNMSNKDAYARTFPQRYADLVAKGATPKDISAYVAMYNKGKLVNAILEQSLIPFHVINQDLRQKALNTQVDLMRNAHSEMVRMQAANSILTHLTPPKELATTQINVNVGESSGLNELQNKLTELAAQQQRLIAAGVSTKEIAAQTLIVDAEVVE